MKCPYNPLEGSSFIKKETLLVYPFNEEIEIEFYRCKKSKKVFAIIDGVKFKVLEFPIKAKIGDFIYIIPFNVWNKYASRFIMQYYWWLKMIAVLWTDKYLFYQGELKARRFDDFSISIYLYRGLKYANIPLSDVYIEKLNNQEK